MSKTTKTAAKTVAKKTEAAVAVVAAEVVTPAAPKKAAKAAVAATPVVAASPAAVPSASAPVEAAAPAPVVSVAEQIQTMVKELSSIRDASSKTIAALRKLEKQHSREVKEAKRRRRVKKDDGEAKETRHPSVFTTPYLLKDTLAVFLGKEKGTKMTPAEVTKAFKVYIDTNGLKGEKHAINPDVNMRSVLGLKADEVLSYRSIQSYLYKLYIKE
jgi:chromatin remodeling complex protein RSC6